MLDFAPETHSHLNNQNIYNAASWRSLLIRTGFYNKTHALWAQSVQARLITQQNIMVTARFAHLQTGHCYLLHCHILKIYYFYAVHDRCCAKYLSHYPASIRNYIFCKLIHGFKRFHYVYSFMCWETLII